MRLIDAETAAMYMPFSSAYVATQFLDGVPTVNAIPIEIVRIMKAEIDNISEEEFDSDGTTCYGRRYKTAAEFKEEVLNIIDKYVGEKTDETDN